ncbi:hypothetical protein BU16DRAFT_527335 [Lophium mytilinum]|uniref:Nab2-like CCCH zinc finger domain-containing protein n=1 Tax=Lophium mytilinum TaxID=390894 RepID=A0A6A6QTS4_9PEZI|nr:hypothetical protein BU16DRAFT_527335 [Lophium mytilinum]
MSIEIGVGTPLAEALKTVIQPQLAEAGWATGGLDDLALAEYIVLMLVNGKTQQEVASEMAMDFLSLPPEDEGPMNFSRWLFEQVDILNQQLNGPQPSEGGNANGADSSHAGQTSGADAEMGDAADGEGGSIPTGPKAMRSGSGNGVQKPRDKRILGQLNKAMDRSSDASLHRVRNGSGTGRVNSHSREPPRGPRSQQLGRGVAAMANGRGMGQMGPMGGMGMPGMPMPMGPNGMPAVMTPQQQLQLLQMYEQQAQMMQTLFQNQSTPNAFVNPNFHGKKSSAGKSLFDRVDNKSGRFNEKRQQNNTKYSRNGSQDETMTDGADSGASGEPKDPSQTRCRFDVSCTKADCLFIHQSPAAPPGTSIDMNDTCSYGAACMNKKCVGKHPSPAQRESHKKEIDCAYYPHCRDQANCPFRHPDTTMPPCRNGADCTTPDCKFAHSKVACKFTPCTNTRCTFKHVEGQKKSRADMQWTADRNGEDAKKEHVSERKFVDDETAEEELILPGKSSQEEMETQIIT